MPHIPFLDDIAAITAIGLIVTLILSRLKLPAVAGLLLAGALLGPAGFGVVTEHQAIEVLAELGVVLLLFTIGLEFKLSRLTVILKQVALGGLLQVGLTIAAVTGVSMALNQSFGRSVFFGFAFALSSTAIVLRALTERRELDAPHGKFIVGTLIFQDLCVIPMVLIVPFLSNSGPAGDALVTIGLALVKAFAVVVTTIVLARLVVPKLFAWVDASRSREVFLLCVLAICLGTAWLTGMAGLSLALGAFLGGMVVADTEYGHRAMGDVMPLRDAFVSIFFVSLGMLFDIRAIMAHPWQVALLTVGFVFGKGILATLSAMAMRFPSRVAWLAGVGLAQFGEFGFVLSRLAQSSGVVTAEEVQPLLAAGIISMFLTPLLVRAAPHVTAGEKLLAPLEKLIGVRGIDQADDVSAAKSMKDHVVVIGYGLAGRVVAKALTDCDMRVVVLELNAETVRSAQGDGISVFYADATSDEALAHAHVADAKALVVVINDAQAAQRVAVTARRVAPGVPILMRSHFLKERDGLLALGVQDVVAEEVEGAVEILVRVLRWMETPRNVIEQSVRVARQATQTSERKQTVPRRTMGEFSALAGLKVDTLRLAKDSPAIGKSAIELNVRKAAGALIIAVQRNGQLIPHFDSSTPFEPDDIVFLQGASAAVRAAQTLLSPETMPPASA